jgi:glycosyltransferase involved in cell wall biosynthesis
MKILLVNKFLYPKGGDAISTINTGRLLKVKGHEVFFWGMSHPQNPDYSTKDYFVDYVDYDRPAGLRMKLKTASDILYSFEAKRKIRRLLQDIKPDIVHLNNFAHQLSPSILDAIKEKNIPTVMTMRDYKLVCPAYSMLREGKPCELCKNGAYYHCFSNRCTKGSRAKSLVNTLEMYLHHNLLHSYDKIDVLISPSEFLKNKCHQMGLKREIIHLPNFVQIEDYQPTFEWTEKAITYVGRLSVEKGVHTLIEAVKGVELRLKIIGDGPLRSELEAKVKNENIDNVVFLGYRAGEDLKREITKSMACVLPSECYENNPRSVIESFALGKPVIGARIGGIPELVRDGETGWTFEAGNVLDLRRAIQSLLCDSGKLPLLGKNARTFVEKYFNSERHYERLLNIYLQLKKS